VFEQVAVAAVGVLGAREPRVLAHRPEPIAVHAIVDAAGERVGARLAEALIQPGGDVGLVVEPVDLDPRVGEHALVLGADDRRHVAVQVLVDRPLGSRVRQLVLAHPRKSRRPSR
jgi:hypothetical protein